VINAKHILYQDHVMALMREAIVLTDLKHNVVEIHNEVSRIKWPILPLICPISALVTLDTRPN